MYTDPDTGEAHNVDPRNIQRVMLFAVEGETDTITGMGQTASLLDMATRLPDDMKFSAEIDTGHYGLFAGRKYRQIIAPQQRGVIRHSSDLHGVRYGKTDKAIDMPKPFSADEHPAFETNIYAAA